MIAIYHRRLTIGQQGKMRVRQCAHLCGAVLGVLLLADSAAAAPVTYAVQGVFDSSEIPQLPVGTAYTATLTFDPATLVPSPDPIGGTRYSFGTVSFSAP